MIITKIIRTLSAVLVISSKLSGNSIVECTTKHEYCIMGLLGFIGLISNATSTGVSPLNVVSWNELQIEGVTEN